MHKVKILTCLITVFSCSIANADQSWYVINNYEGTIGNNPVHISIQNYDFGRGTNIEGSYYYDKYRSPIPLYGKKSSSSIELCEINNDKEYNDLIVEGKSYNPSICPFKLTDKGDVLYGVWQGKKKSLDVKLNRTISLNKYFLSESPTNLIEIPFWGQTNTHSFIGVYEKTENGVSINKVKVINKQSGAIIQVIDPQLHACNFGFYMTPIYQNIEKESDQSEVRLNCYSTSTDTSVIYRYNKINKSYVVVNKPGTKLMNAN